MRHKFMYGATGWRHSGPHYESAPYTTYGSPHLVYKRPSMTRRYCKIIQWIADHPNCSRKEAIVGVYFGKRMRKMYEDRVAAPDNVWSPKHKAQCREWLEKWDRGDFSWVMYNPSRYFAELLWSDMIDYDEKTFKYHVTEKGRALLEEAYLNDNIKLATGKFQWRK